MIVLGLIFELSTSGLTSEVSLVMPNETSEV